MFNRNFFLSGRYSLLCSIALVAAAPFFCSFFISNSKATVQEKSSKQEAVFGKKTKVSQEKTYAVQRIGKPQWLFDGKGFRHWNTKGNWVRLSKNSFVVRPKENQKGWHRFDSYLWSKKKYSDFELSLECSYPKNGNSGIYFRVDDKKNPVHKGIEVQIFDSFTHSKHLSDHSLGGVIPAGISPKKNMAKPPGQWNKMVVRCVRNQLKVTVNGEVVVDVDLKKTLLKDRKLSGFVGLQEHGFGNEVVFRNVQIREIKFEVNSHSASNVFREEALPILKERCFDCHGEGESEGGFKVDTLADLLKGGDSGEPLFQIAKADSSHLLQLLTTKDDDKRMPPEGMEPLSVEELKTIRRLINSSGGWKKAIEKAEEISSDHWSYQKVTPISLPSDFQGNPIDWFVERKLTQKGLQLSPPANDATLFRRLHLIVHGLPPSSEEFERFEKDKSKDRWERLVEKTLESPHYGERSAVNWLDLIRFSESDGFERNTERKGAWRYRDWVVNAFNKDLPYNEFLTRQMAGDQFGDPIATGYLVAGPHNTVVEKDERGQAENVQNEVSDFLNAMGTSVLGTTLGCARCHNHKFDPISQKDFYAIQAVFSGVQHGSQKISGSPIEKSQLSKIEKKIKGLQDQLLKHQAKYVDYRPINAGLNVEAFQPVQAKMVRMIFSKTSQLGVQGCIDELELISGGKNLASNSKVKITSSGNFPHPFHKLAHLNDQVYGNPNSWISKDVSGWVQVEFPKSVKIEKIVWSRDRTGKLKDRLMTEYRFQVSSDGKSWTTIVDSKNRKENFEKWGQKKSTNGEPGKLASELKKQIKSLEKEKNKLLESWLVYTGLFANPQPVHRLYRGDPMQTRERIEPGTIALLGKLNLPPNTGSAQRRIAFAKWVTDPENPLTARVMVNRIWQFHFGKGIVSTENDFGLNGVPPTHPELLDWLAREFVKNDWSIKHIHRLILTSKTWKQSSRTTSKGLARDGGVRLLWRFPSRRLDAESIRDSILAVSGKLNRKLGGLGFSGFEVDFEYVRHYHPKTKYQAADWRRMIYMTRIRKEVESVFGVFDCPSGNQVVPRRNRSTTPLQALSLFNSDFVNGQANFLADRLRSDSKNRNDWIKHSYQLCYLRTPNRHEHDLAAKIIEDVGLEAYCRILLNSNDFVFIF